MRITNVEYLDGYRLRLEFSDKKVKIVDLTTLVKKGGYYFEPLMDIEFFQLVALDDEKYPLSICWPNNADVCPDVLYEMGIEVKGKKKVYCKPRSSRKVKTLSQ